MNITKPPKIKIPKTKSEWFFDIIGYSFYIGSIVFLIIIWGELPNEVPAHYNALGEVDRWGSKWELIILPFIGMFTLILMQSVELFPEIQNYSKRFNETKARQFNFISRQMINQLKNACSIMFALILFESVAIALDWSSGLGVLFLPFVFIVLAAIIVKGLMRFKKVK